MVRQTGGIARRHIWASTYVQDEGEEEEGAGGW